MFDAAKEETEQGSILQQYERLTAPQQMGSLFKVLAITTRAIQPGSMPGFT